MSSFASKLRVVGRGMSTSMSASNRPTGAPGASGVFDLCIVGAGMYGSSAARHAVEMTRGDGQTFSVCLVGPQEPTDIRSQTILGSHYDEARIANCLDYESVVSLLSFRSIARFRQLEKLTGIEFYRETGCLMTSHQHPLPAFHHAGVNAPLQLTRTQRKALLPYLFPSHITSTPDAESGGNDVDCYGLYEAVDAGSINPRQLCLAQQTAAVMRGCHVIRDVVSQVTSQAEGVERVETDGGLVVLAKKVLLAVGAFTEFRRLLPVGHRPLDLQPVNQSVILAELSADDQQKLMNMPALLIPCLLPLDDNNTECYALPPTEYPDGKVYLKLGHSRRYEEPLNSPNEVLDWFQSPTPTRHRSILSRLLKQIFPDVKPVSVHYENCVTTNTATGRPYIDLLTPTLGVALGCNGCGATGCDEIGRLAAHLLLTGGEWADNELTRDLFRAVFKGEQQQEQQQQNL